MNTDTCSVLLVGCGKMGSALLSGWLAAGRAGAQAPVVVVEPGPSTAAFAGKPGVTVVRDAASVPAGFAPGAVAFAVKPQGMDKIVPDYRRFATPGTVFLSIAAGRTLGFFASHLGAEAVVVRSMPNTPAAIGRGITVACANARVSAEQRKACEALLAAVGEVAWVEDEALLDPVTAVSGSGPAYVFWFMEQLAATGEKLGLSRETSMKLALQTVLGAAKLAASSGEPFATLRKNVTSPGGTTEAALRVFDEEQLAERFQRALEAASRRGAELGGELGKD